jgi:hypothetical protein
LRRMVLGSLSGLLLGILVAGLASLATPGTLGENAAFLLTAPSWCFHFVVGGSEGLAITIYFALVGALVACALTAARSRRHLYLGAIAVLLIVMHLWGAALAGRLIFGGPGGFFGKNP